MALKFHCALYLAACGMLAAAPSLAQQPGEPAAVTLDQAVQQVQRETGGRVLSAEPRHVGRRVEYRVKVLTPEGHVRVIAVSSDVAKNPDAAPSTKKPADNGGGNKEKR